MHSREKSLYPPQRRRTPSFSSILLDTIDHSIDEDENQQPCLYQNGIEKQRMNLRQAVMIEDWIEKNYSSTSSSECSSGGIFSSSETDSSYNKQRSRTQKHMNLIHHINSEKQQQQQQNKKNKNKKEKKKQQGWEDGFARTKLRALKIYGELNQKVKQPISPGSKIATFLSSIFNSYNVKKAKMCYVGAVEDVSFDQKSKSPCFSSSVSSFSRRSCMSKTSSSKSNNGVKRTVRFYPVSVILGEDSEQKQQQQQPSTIRKSTRNSLVKEVKKINNVVVGDKEKGGDFRRFCDNGEDEDEDDDAASYSSSDLFELDHLIGDGRFHEELPVYETTNLETNKAIANGLCL